MFETIRRQIPLRLWRRHGQTLFRYATLSKALNGVQALVHYAAGKSVVDTMPLLLKVELSRYCTIDCLGCTFPKAQQFIPLERFKTFVDKFGPFAFMTQLYEVGEPLHHPQLLACLTYAHDRGVGTIISSSLSLSKPDQYWEHLVDTGLDRLIVAIDGTTSSTYSRYRTGGDLSLVMKNLRKILAYRDQRQSSLRVEWQMIDFDWNRAEQKEAQHLSASLGCDDFQLIPDASELRGPAVSAPSIRRKRCLWPYVLLLINAYEEVVPCFKPGRHPGVLGNLKKTSFASIWNGNEIRRIRSDVAISSRAGCRNCIE